MNEEWFAAIALPVSVADDAAAHVTIFVAPRLTPDHDDAVLAEFEVFSRWAAIVARGVSWTLMDQHGEIEADADLSWVDPDLWDRAFPGDTPVGPNRVPDWQNRDWRTFSAKDAADLAKAIHLATIVADPVNPVAPSGHPLTAGIIRFAREFGALRLPGRGRDEDFPVYDESVLTTVLDDRLPRGREGAWTARTPGGRAYRSIAGGDAEGYATAEAALQELHRVRRFYERPESQSPSQVVKSPPDKVAPVSQRAPEFHERIAAAGDHPELLRRLGLLIPVRADGARLRKSEWLAVVTRDDLPEGICRSPRLGVQVVGGDAFISTPNPADPDIWSRGALALGDSDVFDVVDVDVDGSAIKAERFLTTIPRLAIAQLNKTPVDAASPAMRASGFTVTRRQQAGRALTQLGRQEGYQSALQNPVPPTDMPLIHTQDVTRGYRVEVWDSVSRVWHSLHSRRSDLTVNGVPEYRLEENEGFIQGTSATETREQANSPVHVHEAMFGWDGWSLSAPRPGKRVRAVVEDAPDGGSRIVETPEDTPAAPIGDERPPHPFVFTHHFLPNSLPRLRYGRDYSFRAWGVDLGGNVRPHRVGPVPVADAIRTEAEGQKSPLASPAAFRAHMERVARHDLLGGVGDVQKGLHRAVARAAAGGELPEELTDGSSAARRETTASAGERVLDVLDADALLNVARATGLDRSAVAPFEGTEPRSARRSRARGVDLADLRTLGPIGASAVRDADARTVARVVAGKVDAMTRTRLADVAETFRAVVADDSTPIARSTIVDDLDGLREIVASHVAAWIGDHDAPGEPGVIDPVLIDPGLIVHALRTVTPPRPFLRWDPVPVPVVVPLTAYTEGESLRVLVVRSGVTQDPDTLEVAVRPPAEYAADIAATAPLYAESAQRHLAPPKTSQIQAELHGVFDEGIDAGTPDARRRMLAWALRESGTFFDLSVPNATDPNGTPSPQPNVRLLPEPQGGDHFNASDPARPLKVLPPGAPGTPDELILRNGDAPAPGQYVVHDTQQLALPYLPDPLAIGASLAFTQAGAGRTIAFPYGSEGITARYQGAWPEWQPFLLTLQAGEELGAAIDGHRIDISLPVGDIQTFRLSSSIPRDRLGWLGVWRSLDARFTDDPDVQEAAADGLLWGLTPGENVTLVHAVPRPVQAPRPTSLRLHRPAGSTLAAFTGGLAVHGPSTQQVSATVRWTDLVDDLTLDGPVERSAGAAGFTTAVRPQEEVVPVWAVDQAINLPGWEDVLLHGTTHALPDTKHHRAFYRFRASTRFSEYFAPALLTPDAANPLDDGTSVVSEEVEISVPSTVRPDEPKVHSVLPLFRWGEGEEPEQPFGRRRTRGTGVRIYLERPWNSSGDGELLAVLLTPTGNDTSGYPTQPNPAEGFPFVSQWGNDPIWNAPGVQRRAVSIIELDDALSLLHIDDRVEAGRPVAPPAALPLPLGVPAPGGPETVPVLAVGYRPQYNAERQLWYVDIAFDARATFWPFVRLAVARYQPESVAGAHLSTPVRLDFVQLAPERTASVSRTDDTHARVVVTGFTGHRASASRNYPASVAASRRMIARLQRYLPEIGGDLAWSSVDAVELRIRGRASRAEELVWVGELEAGDVIEVRTPRTQSIPDADGDDVPDAATWRVRVEEWERFEGDPPPRAEMSEHGEAPVIQERLVYADDLYL